MMFIFKSYCTVVLLDDMENYKSKYHDCKVGIRCKVYAIKYFSFFSQKRDRERETVREPMKET